MTRSIFYKYVVLALSILFFSTAQAVALENNSYTETSTGADILYPLPNETIVDRVPMISVKLPATVPQLDISTIKLYVDGKDVSAEAQISLDYLIYEPQIPMAFGRHGAVVVAQDIDGKDIAPIQWKFIIASQQPKQAPTARSTSKESFRGRYVIRFKDIYLNEATRTQTSTARPTDIEFEEVPHVKGSFDFTHQSGTKSIIGKIDRDITPISGRARADDGFSFRIVNTAKDEDTTFGDVIIRNTELSINGTPLRGIYRTKKIRKYSLTTFAGRTREPHDGRLKRNSYGMIIRTKASKSHAVILSGVHSKESSQHSKYTAAANSDTLYSLRSIYSLSKHLSLDSEFGTSRHSKDGRRLTNDHGTDSAVRSILSYNHQPWTLSVGTRIIGPKYQPTVYSTYIETNRKGTYGLFGYSNKSKKLSLSTKYDVYHDNLHKTFSGTEQTRSGNSSLSLNYGWILPSMIATYKKQYSAKKLPEDHISYSDRESTIFSLSTTKNIHDTSVLNSNRIQNLYIRSDNDSTVGRTGIISRSVQNRWIISTKYKAFALLTYNTGLTKIHNYIDATSSVSASKTRSHLNGLSLQLHIIPFKFITTLSTSRTMKRTVDTLAVPSAIPIKANQIDYDQKISFLYILSKKKRVNLEIANYEQEFRALSKQGQSYDEQSVEATYMVDF